MSDNQPPQTLNIPSLLLVLALTFLAIRYFFFSPPSSPTSAHSSSSNPRRQVDPAAVEQIAQMFPQTGRREIMWDLQRNGGSVQATTERLLGGGMGLEVPPPSFQPILPSTIRAQTPLPESKPTHPDLITRYNLASRIGEVASGKAKAKEEEVAAKSGWSNNKSERQALLQRRREEMVLAARRKMEEREREKAG